MPALGGTWRYISYRSAIPLITGPGIINPRQDFRSSGTGRGDAFARAHAAHKQEKHWQNKVKEEERNRGKRRKNRKEKEM